MSLSSSKIGFWSVFELVTISQIGSGLMLPAQLAAFGALSLIGWGISGLATLILAIVFAELCARNPKMGGPHVYVQEVFGPSAAFFTGWTYWVVSWVSTVAIITSAVGYISPFFGELNTNITLALDIAIISWTTFVNFKGLEKASKATFSTIVVKLVPLILVPLIALFYFDRANFAPISTFASLSDSISPLNAVILITLWGFIGFESVTAAADKIHQPAKTIRYAMILGTLFVTAVYFISSLGIMGIIPSESLMQSRAPYADAAFIMAGQTGYLLISITCAVICLGAVNAWTLATGQIALGVTQDGLMPKIFSATNKHGAPTSALLISWAGTILILVLIHKESMAQQINMIIDVTVVAGLFIYTICSLAYLKILYLKQSKVPPWQWFCGICSISFCIWVISATALNTLLIASIFTLSGLPIFLIRAKKIRGLKLATSL